MTWRQPSASPSLPTGVRKRNGQLLPASALLAASLNHRYTGRIAKVDGVVECVGASPGMLVLVVNGHFPRPDFGFTDGANCRAFGSLPL
jgi:hypothetical protein